MGYSNIIFANRKAIRNANSKYYSSPVAISNGMRNANVMTLDPSDLDDLDRAILDYLQEGHDEGDPWGRATPSLIRDELSAREIDVPVRQTINNRMKRLELAGHLKNLRDSGVYEFTDDPRQRETE